MGLAGASLSLVRQETSYLKEMMLARAEVLSLSVGSLDARNVLLLTSGVGHHWHPNPTNIGLRPMWWPLIVTGLRDLAIIVFFLAVLGGAFSLQLAVIIQIFVHPNFSRTVSVLVISYTIAIDLIVLTGWYLRKGVYPYKDETKDGVASFFSWAAVQVIWLVVRAAWKSRPAASSGSLASATAKAQRLDHDSAG